MRYFLPLVALTLLGCGGSQSGYDANVQGTVTVDGELANGGTVTFHPTGKGPVAVGEIAKDGSYAVRIGQGNSSNRNDDKIPSGEYVVTASIIGPPEKNKLVAEGGPSVSGSALMADKYASKETSDLKFKIKSGANVIVLKLDGLSANPPLEGTGEEQSTSSNSKGDATITSNRETESAGKATETKDASSSSPALTAPSENAADTKPEIKPKEDQRQ